MFLLTNNNYEFLAYELISCILNIQKILEFLQYVNVDSLFFDIIGDYFLNIYLYFDKSRKLSNLKNNHSKIVCIILSKKTNDSNQVEQVFGT